MHAVGWVWTSNDTVAPSVTGYAGWQSAVVMASSWLLAIARLVVVR